MFSFFCPAEACKRCNARCLEFRRVLFRSCNRLISGTQRTFADDVRASVSVPVEEPSGRWQSRPNCDRTFCGPGVRRTRRGRRVERQKTNKEGKMMTSSINSQEKSSEECEGREKEERKRKPGFTGTNELRLHQESPRRRRL